MDIEQKARLARKSFKKMSLADTTQKNEFLLSLANLLAACHQEILSANQVDINKAIQAGLPEAMVDRLTLNQKRLDVIGSDLRGLAELPDPVGEIFETQVLENGLSVCKVRVPLGVLGIIYESRPNVTIDAASLAIKSGNCAVLRGGSETIESNKVLVGLVQSALKSAGLPEDAIQFIDDPDRAQVLQLLQLDELVDLIIPRGGAALHEFCRKNSRIPVITGGIGICHLYVDESADLQKSIEVIHNAKVQRPTVCNALDTVLINQTVARQILPGLLSRLGNSGVEFRVDEKTLLLSGEHSGQAVTLAGPDDFDTEWLRLVLGIKIVSGLEEAIEHITAHSTGHSDGIMTSNRQNAELFTRLIDSAAVYVNASTRFTDGTQLGLGAEVAISTQRLHARGPMGLRELTTYKWVIEGDYQIRP